jgi:hypothetical protein
MLTLVLVCKMCFSPLVAVKIFLVSSSLHDMCFFVFIFLLGLWRFLAHGLCSIKFRIFSAVTCSNLFVLLFWNFSHIHIGLFDIVLKSPRICSGFVVVVVKLLFFSF